MKSETVPAGEDAAEVSLVEEQGRILPDLTIGAELDSAKSLRANDRLSNPGVKLHGAGFIVTPEKAIMLGLGKIVGLEQHIRPYRNGRDLTDKPREVLVIDLYGLTAQQVLEKYALVYQHILETVKPERDQNNRATYRENWWVFGEARSGFRPALSAIPRYIATVETAKHRIFQFLESEILPDNMLVAIALVDAYYLGILSSRNHVVWSLAAGGILGVGGTPRYNKTRCFDPFPFPDASPAQQARIRELAEQLDAHRKRQQAQHATLTLTDLYNVVEKLQKGETLTAKDQIINQQGLASVVLSLHQQLDAAVAEAYGWPDGLPESEILTRLVRLNHERAAEEQAGHIRYLRPEYQQPGQQQMGLNLPTALAPDTTESPVPAADTQREWPRDLAKQMQAVRDVVQQAGGPISVAQVAARFGKLRPSTVQPLLNTLTALALLRQTDEGAYLG